MSQLSDTQTALKVAESAFLELCDTDECLDSAQIEAAYATMVEAAKNADSAFHDARIEYGNNR